MPIDDPIDAIEKQYSDESSPVFQKMLELFGNFEPTTGLANNIRKVFSKDTANDRIKALIDQFIIEIRRIDAATANLQGKMESPEFAETVLVAVHEAIRTTNLEKIKRFAAILGRPLESNKQVNWDDMAAYIRDIAQLSEKDIEALKALYTIQKDMFMSGRIPIGSDYFVSKNLVVLDLASQAGMSDDEFYSRCARLNGFGLAIEVPIDQSTKPTTDHCFRITTRALQLVSMISD